MADGVAITAGTGTLVSTEEVTNLNGEAVSAQHVQRVIDGICTGNGTVVDAPGDATYGKKVDITRLPVTPYASQLLGTPAAITDDAAHDVIAAPGANYRICITSLTITNAHAETGTAVTLRDGAGATLWQGFCAAAGGGAALTFGERNPLQLPENSKLDAICATTGASVLVSAHGYKAAV
jgi:hypothetical protein